MKQRIKAFCGLTFADFDNKPLVELISMLNDKAAALVKEHGEQEILIQYEDDYDNPSYANLIFTREESDFEYEWRLKREVAIVERDAIAKIKQEEKDKAEYERLKAKFETNDYKAPRGGIEG